MKYVVLCIEVLHELWIERYRIVHKSMMSKIRVEDYGILLNQVKELYNHVPINNTSILHQYKNKLNKVNTEILRGIVYKLLLYIGINSHHTLFNNNIRKTPSSQRRDLTPSIIYQRDLATTRRH